MKLSVAMCHSHLMSMLLQPEQFSNAISSYTATPPDMNGEGFNGYMEVNATFEIKDLTRFSKLWDDAYVFPSDRSKWYHLIKSSMVRCNE